MINSRNIDDLDLEPRRTCKAQVAECRRRGIEIIVTSTYRDFESQDDLYAIGRTKDKHRKPVTNARAGRSWHNFRCAWDVVPVIGGKAVWDDAGLWAEIIKVGKAVGAEAGAEWKTFPDKPHFQVTPIGMTLAKALEVFNENGTIFIT